MSSLFGNAGAQNAPQSNSLFGGGSVNTAAQNQPPGTGLLGSSTQQAQQQQQSSSLFGNSTTQNQNQAAQPTSLFGRPAPSTGGGLFGASTAQNQNQNANQSSSLFGAQPQAQQQQQNQPTSLFGAPAQPSAAANPGNSLFNQPAPQRSTAERTFTNPQQTHLSTLLQSGLGTNPSAFSSSSLALTSHHDLAKSRLQAAGINANPNEKGVVAQLQTLVRKWDPRSQGTLLQSYLYNAVNSAYAPFYYRGAEEGEGEWEEALRKKPKGLEVGGESVAFVPVMVRGFYDLGQRVEYQARIVNDMRARLHEMNNSLDAVMARHAQNVSVRLENAKRQHAALSQRCLRLAVKTQVLRHRGYPLDQSEEGLRKSLQQLEKIVLDPSFAAREEEIWARMVALRERSRWLEEETKRLGGQMEEQSGAAGGSAGSKGVSEEVLLKTKKILGDYSGQLAHLTKELEEVRKEFEEWENSRRR